MKTIAKIILGTIVVCLCLTITYWKGSNKVWKHSPKKRACLADTDLYLQFCQKALSDEKLFASFKSDPVYTLMHEYTTFEEGQQYLQVIEKQAPELLRIDLLEKFRRSDAIGSPKTYEFPQAGLFSPTTLLYMKIASDLKVQFGNLDGLDIVEIGSGYGGLCKVLCDLYQVKSYTLVDIPASLEMAKKYVQAFELKNVHFFTPDQLPKDAQYDLVISHFGFTESGGKQQKILLENILTKSKRGYLTCNFFPKHFNIRALSKESLLHALKQEGIGFQVAKENPKTGKENFLLIWK